MHNLLLIDRPHLTGADTVAAEADRALTAHGLHPVAQLSGLGADELAVALATAGWRIQQFDDLTAPAGPVAGGIADRVSEVELDVVRPVRAASWAATLPGATPEEIAQLVDREAGDARVVAIHHLAVLDGAAVVGTATLKRDGATAWIDGMETAPAHRGRGHGRALLARARELAAEHGCDLVALGADVADWPRDWYLRAGFTAAGTRFEATGPG
nr:GNAT family N-acetyltransferase [Pseudonocardia parietis]